MSDLEKAIAARAALTKIKAVLRNEKIDGVEYLTDLPPVLAGTIPSDLSGVLDGSLPPDLSWVESVGDLLPADLAQQVAELLKDEEAVTALLEAFTTAAEGGGLVNLFSRPMNTV